jgi:hypothetical protein
MKFSDLKVGSLYQCKDKCATSTKSLEMDLSTLTHYDSYHHILYLKKPFIFLGFTKNNFLSPDEPKVMKILIGLQEGLLFLEEEMLDDLVEL